MIVWIVPMFIKTILAERIRLEISGRLLATPHEGDDLVVALPWNGLFRWEERCSLFNLGLIDHVAPCGKSGREFLVRTRESGGLNLHLRLADGVRSTASSPSEVA